MMVKSDQKQVPEYKGLPFGLTQSPSGRPRLGEKGYLKWGI
ncbi:MAG: hypothetical protein ACK4OO_06735 [bacterium]